MAVMHLWTKQHKDVLRRIEQEGRYTVQQQHVILTNEDTSEIFLTVYDWYVSKAEVLVPRPEDVQYPVWCSLSAETAMLPDEMTDSLELEVESSLVVPVHIGKWSTILNYAYIAGDEADRLRHLQLLQNYNTNDATAFMTPFHPIIKREIIESWDRLFDSSIGVPGEAQYGTIWEIRKEWLMAVNGKVYTESR